VLRTTKRLYIILVFGLGLTVMIVGKSNQLPLGPPPITGDCLYGCFLPKIEKYYYKPPAYLHKEIRRDANQNDISIKIYIKTNI